jgi:tRNA threonylcarbamoyladenosine biosynthesis protein TsaE
VVLSVANESEMLALGAKLASVFAIGDLVYLEGNLGAGKTTLVRGILAELGWKKPVRSPTFNLFNVYETVPPVVHADLYRLNNAFGTGIEDYLETHVVLVEWPAALGEPEATTKRIQIEFDGDGRKVLLSNINL